MSGSEAPVRGRCHPGEAREADPPGGAVIGWFGDRDVAATRHIRHLAPRGRSRQPTPLQPSRGTFPWEGRSVLFPVQPRRGQ